MSVKIRIVSPDAHGKIDCTNSVQLLQHLPIGEPADVTVVPIAYWPDYVFNPELWKIKGPVVLIDYVEFGWSAGTSENRFGEGIACTFDHLATEEWMKFDQWVHETPIGLTFKRELQAIHQTETMLPIEYLCYLPIPPVQSRAEFEARPYDSLHVFGYSHQHRLRVHGEMFRAMGEAGINLISDWSHFGNLPQPLPPRSHVSIYSPWYVRQPMSVVMEQQLQSKVAVSLWGAGKKSFRDAEAPVGCIMARPEDELAWSYRWTYQNSIQLEEFAEVVTLLHALERDDLYDTYVAGQENIRKYECATYVRDYILPAISRIL